MATTHPALAAVLANPAIWRGGDCAPEPAAVPSGFAALDAVLPGRGWPGAALTEVVLAREGIGEIRLTLPALVRLQSAGRDIVWIAPPHVPYAPALAAAGINLARLLVVRCRTSADALWAYEQALRAPECGAAFAWLDVKDDRLLRRLAVAARDGRTWGVLWRRPGQRGTAAAAPLRLALAPQDGRLAVKVVKRRGGELAQPVIVDVNAAPAPTLPDSRKVGSDSTFIEIQCQPRRPPESRV
ncbi:MAG: translesion DNA synthesis-associated protein ImuA [Betaproteobacteria bacterium]